MLAGLTSSRKNGITGGGDEEPVVGNGRKEKTLQAETTRSVMRGDHRGHEGRRCSEERPFLQARSGGCNNEQNQLEEDTPTKVERAAKLIRVQTDFWSGG